MTASAVLAPHVADFLAGHGRFATIATLDVDGAPRQAVTWYTFESDGRITLNSLDGRRWPANLRRDPRLSLTIADPADGYRFVALAGVVEDVVEDVKTAREEICAMARRYHADDPASAAGVIARFMTQQRVSFRVRIAVVHDHLA